MEHHDVVQPVDELRAEVRLHHAHHRRLHLHVGLRAVIAGHVLDLVRAQIGGHHDDGVAEVHGAALAIGEAAIVQHLQQDVEHIGVRLFHFVEQDQRVRAATHGLGEVTALFVAHVTRGRTDQARHAVLFHELAHVDADHGVAAVEQELGQRLAQLGLAHAGRAQEQERAAGPVRVGQAGTRTAHRVGDDLDRLFLAHHPLMQHVLHAQQLVALAFQHAVDRNAGPARDHLGDLLGGDPVLDQLELGVFRFLRRVQLLFQLRQLAVLQFAHAAEVLAPLRRFQFQLHLFDLLLDLGGALQRGLLRLPDLVQVGELALQRIDLGFQVGQALARGVVLFLLQHLALDLELDQAPFQAVQFFRLGVDLHADARGRLVHQVDGLVRQLAVGDVAVRQRGRSHNRRVGDLHPVVYRVLFLQPAQDRDGVFHARLAHEHLLEAALQRGILLDVLAVLVQGGGTHAVQLATRQRRLEHVARVHRAIGLARADHGVQFVDEQNDLAFALGQVIQHALQALFELTAELGTGDQRAHVQRQHALAAQALGHFVVDDALGQPFHDGGLAHARFADQHRVVLGAALQDLDGAADFLVAPDHRVQLAALGARGQVDGVLLQRLALFFGIFRLHAFATTNLVDGRVDLVLVGTGSAQRHAQRAAIVERGQHEPLAGDERIAMLLGQFVGLVEQPVQVVADRQVAFLPGDLRQGVQRLGQPLAQHRHIDPRLGQQRARAAALLVEQRSEHVHRFDDVVVAAHGQRLCVRQRLLETRGELVHPHGGVLDMLPLAEPALSDRCGYAGVFQGAMRTHSGPGRRGSDIPITPAWQRRPEAGRSCRGACACITSCTTGPASRAGASSSGWRWKMLAPPIRTWRGSTATR